MGKLDRYLLFSLLKNTIFTIFVSTLILVSLQLVNLSKKFAQYGLDLSEIFHVLIALVFSFLPLIIPIAFLFSLLMVFSSLSEDREIVAFQSLGHSHWRIMRAPLALGAFMCGLTLFCVSYLSPQGDRLFWSLLDEAKNQKLLSVISSGTFAEGFFDSVFYAEKVDPVKGTLEKVFVYDEQIVGEGIAISAKSGEWKSQKNNNKDSKSVLTLYDGSLISFDSKTSEVKQMFFGSYQINASAQIQPGKIRNWPPGFSLEKLFRMRKLKEGQIKIKQLRKVWAELARRFALAFLCLIFIPLSFSFAVSSARAAKSKVVLVGVSILGFYWLVHSLSLTWVVKTKSSFVESESMLWLVIWAPNIILLGLSLHLIRRKFSFKAARSTLAVK